MLVGPAAKVDLIMRPLPINRKVDSYNAGSSTCSSPLQKSPVNQQPSTQTVSGFQHSCGSGSECKRGVDLVAGKPAELEWESSAGTKPRYSGRDGCVPAWMGCSLGRDMNRRLERCPGLPTKA